MSEVPGHPSASVLSDADIARLTPQQRIDLLGRLQREVDLPLRGGVSLRRVRWLRLGLMTTSAAVLVPWVVWLAVSLPRTYQARHWAATWVGFDLALVALLVASVVFGLLRSQLVVLTSFATGVLLVCDAWFDVMTAEPADRPWSIASALLAELPIAAVLVLGSLRFLHVMATRMWLLEPGQRLWQLRFPRWVDVTRHD